MTLSLRDSPDTRSFLSFQLYACVCLHSTLYIYIYGVSIYNKLPLENIQWKHMYRC